ncbi:MAG: tetratricopeptide repeat protein, partial [Candidatus Aminicenantes bacterium]|nr:tetratricopeptide repeat protein [Candidatus Aminicenantes bacterium]
NYGTLLSATKDYSGAREKYEKALPIYEAKNGPDHPAIANILFDMSLVERETGNYGLAQAHLERAININEKAHGAESLGVASCLSRLANLYAKQGDLTTADSYLQDSLRIFEKNPEENSYRAAFAQATYWALTGDRDKAIVFLKLAIERGHKAAFSNHADFENLLGDPEFEALKTEQKTK